MNKLLGEKWILKILVLIIIGFWPLIYFSAIQNMIEFNPAKFTEEWIKTFLTVIVIGTLLKYYDSIIKKRENQIEIELSKIKIISAIDNFEFTNAKLKFILDLIQELRANGYFATTDIQLLFNASEFNVAHLTEPNKTAITEQLKKLKSEFT